MLDVQAALRIDSADSLSSHDAPLYNNNYDDEMELDDDELLALGPPQLVRNPNTTLLAAIAQEEAAATQTLVSASGPAGSKPQTQTAAASGSGSGKAEGVDRGGVTLNAEAGVPGVTYTLLPKSSRGLLTPLSDQDAFLLVQRELDIFWGATQPAEEREEGAEKEEEEEAARRQDIMRYLEESNMARKNVLALQASNFLFAQQETCSSSPSEDREGLCGDIDSYSNQSPLSLSRKSPAKTPEKVKFSENVDASSSAVRQDCLLLGAPECALSFLGTGCAIPSKYRNVSGILLQLSAESSMLLDCGEGTWQQLVRMAREHPGMCRSVSTRLASPKLSSLLVCQWLARNIKVVWISHPHADHHLGLMTLVAERKRHWVSDNTAASTTASSASATAPVGTGADSSGVAEDFVPLLIIAPASVLTFLDCFTSSDPLMRSSYIGIDNHAFEPEWAKSSNKIKHRKFGYASSCKTDGGVGEEGCEDGKVLAETTDASSETVKQLRSDQQVLRPVDQQLLSDIGIQSLQNVQVHHCFQSFGLRVNSSQGWSLIYSGDTRPCPQLVRLGQGATVLVHEATFDDTRPLEAVKKRHSTISEAIQVAKDMNAHRLILTHFSQRYPGMPPLPPDYLTLPCGLLLAFDFMHVKFADLLWTHTMNPALLLAFPPEECTSAADDGGQDLLGEERAASSSTSSSRSSAGHASKDPPTATSGTKKRPKQQQQQHIPRNKKVKST